VSDLRHEPVQKRAVVTLEKIAAAAREALATHGRDRLTTAHVAELAGVSIGTVYRYFPDRVAVLDAVAPYRDAVPVGLRCWVVLSADDDGADALFGVFASEGLAKVHAEMLELSGGRFVVECEPVRTDLDEFRS
jgi:Bacterial regulatory proteins, tetR family